MNRLLKQLGIVFALLLIIDGIWLYSMQWFYADQLGTLMRSGQLPAVAGFLAWFLIALGVVLFVLPTGKWYIGTLYGLVLYGVYELTNYFVIANYPLTLTIVDMLWGAVLNTLIAVVYFRFFTKNKE